MGERLLAALERRFGAFSVPGLAAFLTGMNAVAGVLTLLKPEFPTQLMLAPELVRQGQLWRLATFLFIPPTSTLLGLVFWILLIYGAMSALENAWGEFRFTLFWAAGAAAASAASLAFGQGLSNVPLNTSLFLAFARLFPDMRLLLFFVFPVTLRRLAAVAWLVVGWSVLMGGAAERVGWLAGLVNYSLFFGRGHWTELRLAWRSRR